jgi:hypothetical protein
MFSVTVNGSRQYYKVAIFNFTTKSRGDLSSATCAEPSSISEDMGHVGPIVQMPRFRFRPTFHEQQPKIAS